MRKTLGTLGALVALATHAGAQECRLDYQSAATGAAQITVGAGQLQDLTSRPARGVRTIANRGGAPVMVALVGAAIPGYPATPGDGLVKALGGAYGGVLGDRSGGPAAMGGMTGGVLGDRSGKPVANGGVSGGVLRAAQGAASLGAGWISLAPGQRIDNLSHDLAAVACGDASPVARALGAGH